MMAAAKLIEIKMDLITAETFAVRYGVELACATGFSSLIVESDSLTTVKALTGSMAQNPFQALHVEDTLHLASSLSVISFNHVKRVANQLAHALAKEAFSLVRETIWMEELPASVLSFATLDI